MWLSENQWEDLAKVIPNRQLLAFRLVFSEGLSYEQAAQKMGISEQAISGLIKRMRLKYPDCIPNTKTPKTLRFDPDMDGGEIEGKF
ncbi:hypothetical protein LCGC14_1836520 [marine sediment metagenome]|uniref:RNA polymerase sigma factor 70 region 4 type 2 domain-containing protein n=1 Tax=marine sediment metagenome TaxID=412755 RepID=A0A0F9H2K6_9ZZZZ